MIKTPPIKCQGIKTKLAPKIIESMGYKGGTWIEPFFGSGAVGFNASPTKALFSDTNPHLISFYVSLAQAEITPAIARDFLENEGAMLGKIGGDYYYEVRDRFNESGSPLDFLFINRSCFNGVIRFNRSGRFNTPFCRKRDRFSKAYITKIVNQISWVFDLIRRNDWEFVCQDFRLPIAAAHDNDVIYCDPPYGGRHADYFNLWGSEDEDDLFRLLSGTKARFVLSTWMENEHRRNPEIDKWERFNISVTEHFYHVGASESNRKPMTEALVFNRAGR